MNAMVKPVDQVPVIQAEGATLLAVISRAASDPQTDVTKMERLMAMYQAIEAKRAEAAFNASMTQAQTEIGRVATDKENSQTKSSYATYAQLDRAVRPAYTSYGFALSFGTEPSNMEGMITVVCHVSHTGGHSRDYRIDMPADGKGAKGGDVMTKTHAVGSGATYGMRYLLKMIFNIAIGVDPDDDDGNASAGPSDHQDWLNQIAACVDIDGLRAVKKELTLSFGTKPPPTVIGAYNEKLHALGGGKK